MMAKPYSATIELVGMDRRALPPALGCFMT
jgi:hypothetical protein